MEAPEQKVKQIITEIANPIEAVVNILYLIKEERYDPDKVLRLTVLAEAPIRQLSNILRSGLS